MGASRSGAVQRLVAAVVAAVLGIAAVLVAADRGAADAAAAPGPATSSPARPASSATATPSPTPSLPAAHLTAAMTPSRGAPESIIRISGRLTDSHGRPVDGASIAVQGSFDDVPRAFSATDRNGTFTAAIQVPPGTGSGAFTIRASLVGDTRYRPVSQTWPFAVEAPAGSPTPSAPGSPGASRTDSSEAEDPASQEDSQEALPQSPASASPLTVGGQRDDRPAPPGLLTALGGRTAVGVFVIVLATLLVLALIGWVIRAIARWIHRRRHPEDADQGPADGANDLFE